LDFDVVLVAPDGSGLRHRPETSGPGPRPGASVPAGADREDLDPRQIKPRQGFDLTLPLEKAAEGYAAMDDRTAIPKLLQP